MTKVEGGLRFWPYSPHQRLHDLPDSAEMQRMLDCYGFLCLLREEPS